MSDYEDINARDDLAAFATRYVFKWKRHHTITIEQYDNHGRLMPDGNWVVARWISPMGSDLSNVLYLGSDGGWRYKVGARWATLDDAWAALAGAESPDRLAA